MPIVIPVIFGNDSLRTCSRFFFSFHCPPPSRKATTPIGSYRPGGSWGRKASKIDREYYFVIVSYAIPIAAVAAAALDWGWKSKVRVGVIGSQLGKYVYFTPSSKLHQNSGRAV